MTVGFKVVLRTMSLDVASKLDVAGMFTANATGQGLAVFFDALLQDDSYEYVPVPDAPYIKCRGVGLRIAMRANRANVQGRLSFAALAAQTELEHVSIRYVVRAFGLAPSVVGDVLAVDVEAPFDTGAYQQIHSVISTSLPDYLASATSLSFNEFSIPVPSFQDDPAERARAIHYGISKVAQGRSLKKALAERPASISPEVVLMAYAQVLGAVSSDSDTSPTADQQVRANTWLATGRMG